MDTETRGVRDAEGTPILELRAAEKLYPNGVYAVRESISP